jgi:hypothetical protein
MSVISGERFHRQLLAVNSFLGQPLLAFSVSFRAGFIGTTSDEKSEKLKSVVKNGHVAKIK